MSKYVEVQSFWKKLKGYPVEMGFIKKAYISEVIDELAEDIVVKFPKGHWEDCSNGWMCSNCERDSRKDSKYCPNCGADMRGDEDEVSD